MDSLNKAQQEAVDFKDGQLLVVAGAGTGKTRVIVQRISQLLDDGIEPHRILAVTFTEKAASEMLDRLLDMRPDLHADLPILTFNSFGEGILREFNTEIGLAQSFSLLGDSAKTVFLEQHLDELGLDFYAPATNPKALLPDISKYFSVLKQNMVTPSEYQKYAKGMPSREESEKLEKKRHQELAKAYQNYIRLTQEYNVIDLDDQIYRAVELLKARPNTQAKLQERYKAIMIDEFQDTNPMQSVLIDLLSGKDNSLMVVGDDDQSIYGFRGATLANILDFKQRYPKSREVTLIENYRSGQQILDSAYQLVQNNNPHRLESRLKINKHLHAQHKGQEPSVLQFSSIEFEMQWLVDDITERLARGEPASSIAVLVRRNKTAEIVAQALHLADIKFRVVGERYQLYRTEVVRMIVEALNAINDPSNNLSLYHTLGGGLFGVPGRQLAKLSGEAKSNHQSLEEFLRNGSTDAELKKAIKLIDNWRDQASLLPVGKLVYSMLEDTGFKSDLYAKAMNDNLAANTVTQLSEFFRTLKEFESIALQPTAAQYLESFPVLEAAGETNEDNTLHISNDDINIMTIHKAKGLEWETVYLPDVTEGSFPLKARPGGIALPEKLANQHHSEADDHIAEERRLMYVAMTRARSSLVLTYSLTHNHRTTRKPSMFIREAFNVDSLQNSDSDSTPNSLELVTAEGLVEPDIKLPSYMYDGQTLRMSVSQIVNYLNCPLDFYYRYVLNVPQESATSAIYGQVIHKAIERINLALLSDEPLDLDEIEGEALTALEGASFDSRALQERLSSQAKTTIHQFYQDNYVGKNKPLQVEAPFKARFRDLKLIIGGRLDAVFATDRGIEIRDYKTSSSIDTDKKAKRKATSSPQLTLYALVWKEMNDELPTKVALDYVDTGAYGDVSKTQKSLDTMRDKLEAMVKKITAGSYEPGSNHMYCQHPPLD